MMFDFCANTLGLATEKCIEAVGTKRVLFGTDMPIAKMRMYRISEDGYYINVVPRGAYGDVTGAAHMRESDEANITNFTYEIIRGFKECATNLSLSKKDVEDIMCNNADIAVLNEQMVCLFCIARVIPKFSDHHIEVQSGT